MNSAQTVPVSKSFSAVDPAVLAGVQQHLEGLKKTTDGKVLFNLIERGLHRYGNNGQIERTFFTFLNTLLRKYTQHPKSDPATRFKARVIQQRLLLNMPHAEPAPDGRASAVPLGDNALAEVLATTASAPLTVKQTKPIDQAAPAVPVADEKPVATLTVVVEAENQKFERLLQDPATIELAPTTESVNDIEGMLASGIEHLIEGHQRLGLNLQRAGEYLRTIQSDRHELQRQLHRARTHSLIDDLTGLPNRMAFMRQLTAEIGRAKRYGGKLSVALIGLDDIHSVAGDAAAGDQVVSLFASRVLTHFRAYDVVARYSATAFAIVFPSTGETGAKRALEKLRAQIAQGATDLQGRKWSLPLFSAVVAVYNANEKPATMMRRADEALECLLAEGAGKTVIAP